MAYSKLAGKPARETPFPAYMSRALLYALRESTNASRSNQTRPGGVAYTLSIVCMEMTIMARGGKKTADVTNGSQPPRFVDVKLSVEQRAEFLTMSYTDQELVTWLESFVNDGYRVGFSWAGEQQAYFVSVTGRDSGTPNDGYCMTSFAKDVRTAVALSFFKHTVVTGELWVSASEMASGSFG